METSLLRKTQYKKRCSLRRCNGLTPACPTRRDRGLLRALDADPRLARHHRLAAVRAHLLEKFGDSQAAIAEYRLAASRTSNVPERNYLLLKAARLAVGA
jgi:predicted RNA polymerase sigma factor